MSFSQLQKWLHLLHSNVCFSTKWNLHLLVFSSNYFFNAKPILHSLYVWWGSCETKISWYTISLFAEFPFGFNHSNPNIANDTIIVFIIKQFQVFQTSSSDAIIQKRGMRRYVLNYYQKSNTLSLFSTIKMWQNDKICFLIILTWHPKKDQNFNCAFEDDKWRIFPNAFNPFISSDWQIDFYELHSFW